MELLKQLFAIHSPSGNEVRIRKFIKKWVRENVESCTIKGDAHGNMFITKGTSDKYPCIVAHLDQVQWSYPDDYQVSENGDIIFAYSTNERMFCGLGADDKCGIWIALQILAEFPCVKVAFFSGEEIGCVGSRACDMAFFDDTMYIVEPDRRGSQGLITNIGGSDICSEEFVEAIQPKLFGYRPERGLMTDVEELRDRGYPNSCINLSCGYYDPHTNHEFVSVRDLRNALEFVRHIVQTINEPQPFTTPVCYCEFPVDPYDVVNIDYKEYEDTYNYVFEMLDWHDLSKMGYGLGDAHRVFELIREDVEQLNKNVVMQAIYDYLNLF